jgi:uncharacterized protein YqgV (UPF0045/DUF77 family)
MLDQYKEEYKDKDVRIIISGDLDDKKIPEKTRIKAKKINTLGEKKMALSNAINNRKNGMETWAWVNLGIQYGSRNCSLKFSKPSEKGDRIHETLSCYHNSTVNKLIGRIVSRLNSISRQKEKTAAGWMINERDLKQVLEWIEEANEAIHAESQYFVDHYDDKKQEFVDKIMSICVKNKKKGEAKKHIKNALRFFPSKEYVLSTKISYFVDSPYYDKLDDETKSMIDKSREDRESSDTRAMIVNNCQAVLVALKNLYKKKEKIHGSTVNAYNRAVDDLREMNEIYLLSPLPELTAFIAKSQMVIDDPVGNLYHFIMAFCTFYYNQGLIDELPFEELEEIGFDRDSIEVSIEYANDPANGERPASFIGYTGVSLSA